MAEDKPDLGIINPNETPQFPPMLAAEFEGDHGAVAEAAWQQARGSMVAFEQLCAEYMRGELDLLGEGEDAVAERKKAFFERQRELKHEFNASQAQFTGGRVTEPARGMPETTSGTAADTNTGGGSSSEAATDTGSTAPAGPGETRTIG